MNKLNILLIIIGITFISVHCVRDENKEVKITPEFIKKVHQYDELSPYHEGLAIVSKNGKKGFINTNGELAIPCQFFGAGDFSENLAPRVSNITSSTAMIRVNSPYAGGQEFRFYLNASNGTISLDSSEKLYLK